MGQERLDRRAVLTVLAGGCVTVVGCSQPSQSPSDSTSESGSTTRSEAATTATESDSPEMTTDGDSSPGAPAVDPDVLVELYDVAADFHALAEQQFEDGLSQWNGDQYTQGVKQFSYAQQSVADSNAILTRVTDRITEAGVGGFRIADAARTRTNLLERAASNYGQACVSMLDGEESTAKNHAANAASFRTRADNHPFESPGAFETALRESVTQVTPG